MLHDEEHKVNLAMI